MCIRFSFASSNRKMTDAAQSEWGIRKSPVWRISVVLIAALIFTRTLPAQDNARPVPPDRYFADPTSNFNSGPDFSLLTQDPDMARTLRAAEIAPPAVEPDVAKPGPDMGDYPNSAFTLPKGQVYVEMAPFTYQTADANNSTSYNWPFLLRYGLTDDVEFRLVGSGLTAVYDPGDTIVGFSPLILDTKVHLWDDRMSVMLPAASLEVFLQTQWGSEDFLGGVQPSINLNLDFPFTKKTNVEMTLGYSGVQDAVHVATGSRFIPKFNRRIPIIHRENLNVYQFSYQWAIEHQLTPKFQVFVHGYYNGPILLQSGPGTVVGVGYFYQMSQRAMLFNSYNAGVDKNAAPFSTQFGLALAF